MKYPPGSFGSSPWSISFCSVILTKIQAADFAITGISPMWINLVSRIFPSSTTLASNMKGATYETLRRRASAGVIFVIEPSSSVILGR